MGGGLAPARLHQGLPARQDSSGGSDTQAWTPLHQAWTPLHQEEEEEASRAWAHDLWPLTSGRSQGSD